MLPFSLKVVWFCLSFSGIIACWVVQYMFSRAVGSYWGPMLYSIFATLLQGVFCLGMIYNMNPYQMPKTFCIVQTFVIYYSAWSLSGVSAAFTFATSSSVLWPSLVRYSAASTLTWRNMYYIPIFGFPLACLSVSVPVLLRVNAIQPTDNMQCDASHPEWGRFLGYAGFPILLSIPSFFLSAAAARRVIQLHRDSQRTQSLFKYNTGQTHPRSPESHGRITEGPGSPPASPDTTALGCTNPEIPCSSSSIDATVNTVPNLLPSAAFGGVVPSPRRTEIWEVICTMEEGESDTRRQTVGMTLSSTTPVAPPRSNLAQAIWWLILFQIVCFICQCLAALSTIIDVARRQPTPTPFGSQHFALVFVGWGPAIVFGHLPAVRRQLMFWKG